ncbi:MAG: hypothetical protein ACI857_002043, partial [Arenicella sp.]
RDKVIKFLEASLNGLGFNQTEKTDFITFWAPKMLKSNFVFVQFIWDEDYDKQIATLDVSPKPDASRRVYMYFKGYDALPEIETTTQSFEGFERKGFTLFEWGGTEIKTQKFKL